MTSQARLRTIADNQTGVAKKVLDAVPLRECWTTQQIASELWRRQHGVAKDALEGTLYSLLESGLIKQPTTGRFQRIVEDEPTASAMPKAPPVIAIADPPPAPPTSDAFGRIATLTAELRRIADQIDEAALKMAEESAAANAKLGPLQQLRELLKAV